MPIRGRRAFQTTLKCSTRKRSRMLPRSNGFVGCGVVEIYLIFGVRSVVANALLCNTHGFGVLLCERRDLVMEFKIKIKRKIMK